MLELAESANSDWYCVGHQVVALVPFDGVAMSRWKVAGVLKCDRSCEGVLELVVDSGSPMVAGKRDSGPTCCSRSHLLGALVRVR